MLFRKRHSDFGDPTTNKLLKKGVYNFDNGEYVDDDRHISFFERNMVVGMWYVFILSVLLWWLPVFGQMIAGYLGGRKAGTSIRGVFVTLIPCFIIIILLVLIDVGLLPSLGGLAAIPSSLIGGVGSVSPQAGAYIAGIYNSLLALMGLNGNGIIVIMVFGLIGGMMADMNKKEVAQATGNSHFYDGFSSFLSGANIGKFADLVAERVMWTLGTMDTGRKKLLHRAHPEPDVMGFGDLKSLPPPSHNPGSQPRLREWMGPEPEPAFGYDSPYGEEDEHDLLEGLPKWEPKPPRKNKRKQRNPYEEDWGVSHADLSEEELLDSWIEQRRNFSPPKTEPKKGIKSQGTRKSSPKKRSPVKKPQKKPVYKDDEFDFEEESRPKRKSNARKPAAIQEIGVSGGREGAKPRKKGQLKRTEKRDAVMYDSKNEEQELKESPKKKPLTKKEQPALIKRALETQKKIAGEKEKTVPEPDLPEEKAPKPKKEKFVQNYDML